MDKYIANALLLWVTGDQRKALRIWRASKWGSGGSVNDADIRGINFFFERTGVGYNAQGD